MAEKEYSSKYIKTRDAPDRKITGYRISDIRTECKHRISCIQSDILYPIEKTISSSRILNIFLISDRIPRKDYNFAPI